MRVLIDGGAGFARIGTGISSISCMRVVDSLAVRWALGRPSNRLLPCLGRAGRWLRPLDMLLLFEVNCVLAELAEKFDFVEVNEYVGY